ncbi:hypothetical protein [Streptomyces sp. CB01881]|uniref:hypothetical protein n=1 Tax=Streptomyces sp. CB01881 TaxID=2078691 RepID=UPI000CDC264C|nr:hypothetical protein [Streptomyces sp. CB01881]AUY51921.1 hypothetical protein C2142_26760 [Streptomyces sp. CB01881]TYC71350.1 hypothetical protein EH183_26740 [Streptomyces sp. CB01881]
MSDQQFIAYMEAFQAAIEHAAACEPCQNDQPCAAGDPIHADFCAKQDAWEDRQRRERRNERRRAKRRADSRFRIARHAAWQLVTYGRWENGRPAATDEDVIRAADAMYGGYLKSGPITRSEAATALAAVLGN